MASKQVEFEAKSDGAKSGENSRKQSNASVGCLITCSQSSVNGCVILEQKFIWIYAFFSCPNLYKLVTLVEGSLFNSYNIEV